MKKKKKNIFGLIIGILLIVTSLVLFYFINKLNVLETKYLIIVGAILILIYAIILFKILRKKTRKWSKFLFYLISILLIIIYSIGIRYIATTINFFENMKSGSREKQTYSVVVLNDSGYASVNDLNGKNIGFLSTNPDIQKSKDKFNQKSGITYNENNQNITDLIVNLNSKKLDAIVIDKSLYTLLEENQEKFVKDTKVIYEYTIYVNRRIKDKKVDVTKDPFAFYISGSDSRTTLSDNDRSDVNIVAVINPKTHKILLVNIPRDVYVQLHGITGTKDKLTHAGLYGVDMSVATIEDLLDMDINYYAKVGFETLIKSVDVIGGIEINSPSAFTTWSNKEKCEIKKGRQHVDGNCALAFSRERKSMSAGDYTRGENQQQVITAMINKMSNPSILTKYNSILNAIDGSFKTNMTYDEITSLIKSQISSGGGWNIESTSIGGDNGYDYTYSMGNQKLYVTYPSEKSIEIVQEKVNEILYSK